MFPTPRETAYLFGMTTIDIWEKAQMGFNSLLAPPNCKYLQNKRFKKDWQIRRAPLPTF
jgi:hypothetical protein